MPPAYVHPPTTSGIFTIRDTTVVDVRTETLHPHQDIHIADGKIAAITHTGATTDEQTIDGHGTYVVPGFIDAHTHALNWPKEVAGAYALMLANGVVGFRQMSGSPELLTDRAAGRLPAPTGAPELLATCGTLLTPMNTSTAEDAAKEVRTQHKLGADFIKAGMTQHDGFFAALTEAQRLELPLDGHLPGDVDPREAAQHGMRCIEHLGPGATVYTAASTEEKTLRAQPQKSIKLPKVKLPGMERVLNALIARLVINPAALTSTDAAHELHVADTTYDEAKAAELADLFIEHDTWQCPTLIRLHTQQFPDTPAHQDDPRQRYIAPAELKRWRKATKRFAKLPDKTRKALREHWDAQLRMTKLFADKGVPMIAGTDANGAGWVIPGFALHDEFDLLADAGLSPVTILQMATSNAARFFGRADTHGQVAQGFHADLVLLQRNPLSDHTALHEISGVVRDGGWWSRADLDAILDRLAADPSAR
ncbi:amidohydrolase family protein [Gordonia sp. CPCC 205515]|uniref:amidohydrolase family protein n=1 Tax=Gordonia sp. CPCC 205515 TaxID=3140791 RepID=UPI003AF3949F